MSRFRTMRRALLATSALVAAISIPAARSDETVSGGATLDLVGGTVFHNNLVLEDGILINGTFNGSVLFDVRKGSIDAVLAGTGALVKSTSDTVTLTGTNTYTGLTTINAGTLVVDDGGTLGAAGGDLVINDGGTLNLMGTTQTVGALSLTGDAVVTGGIFAPDPHAFLTVSSVVATTGLGETAAIDVDLSTSGTITKNGLGTLRLGGFPNSIISGPINVNAGTLQLVWQNGPGAPTINMNGASTLSLNNGTGNGQNFYNPVNLNSAGVDINVATNISVQHGVISGSFGLEKTGAGTLGLASANTYTGLTTVSNGYIQLQDGVSSQYGSIAGDIALTGGSLALVRTDSAMNLTGNISGTGQVYSDFLFGSGVLSGNNTFSGGVFLFGGTLKAGSSNAFGSGIIGGMPGTLLDLNGFDVTVGGLSGGQYDLDGRLLTLAGTTGYASGSTFTAGNLTLANGSQQVFDGVDLSPISTLTVNGSAVFFGSSNIAADTIALGSTGTLNIEGVGTSGYVAPEISGSGAIALGDRRLETGGSNANTTLSGTISGFNGSLKKVGSGTLTLSGTNTFTGGIEVAGGTLSLASNGAAGTGSITTTGSVIDYGAGVNNAAPIILNSNTTQLQVTSSATQSGVISETGGSRPLEKIGNGVLTMTAANTYTGTTTISAGRIILSGAGEILGDVHIANNTPNDFFEISKSANWTYGGVISGYNVALTGSGTTTWTGENTHAYTGITDGTLTFSGAGTLGAANTWVLMSGGIVDLNGTTQSAGIFTLYDGGTGLVTNGNLNVSSVFYADSGTMAANLGGAGALAKFSAGTSIVSGSNSYGGQTLINGGTLVAQGGSAITDTSVVTIALGATLQIDSDETIGSLVGAGNVGLGSNTLTTGVNNTDTTFTGVISGSGGLEKAGTGIFTLTGGHTYTGLTTVSNGRLQLGTGGTIAGDIHVVDNGLGWFDFVQSGSYTYSGVLSGGQISQSGAGTTTLTGANTNSYLGIGQGTLTVSGLGTIGASNMEVGLSGFGSTATLDLGGTTQNISLLTMFDGYDNAVVNGTLNASTFLFAEEGLISANLTGTATLVKNGSGTTTLSGSNTYTGQTTINAGTLVLQGGNAIDNANAVTIGAGATLQLDGDETIGSLAGGGNLALTTKSLTAGGNNGTTLFTGTIFGGATSSLQKAGTGTLHVVGNMNQESTTVTAGQLNFNGTALGNIAVNAGAVLSGTNTINGNLINLGTVSSGNSPGTTTVLGNYTGGGTLDVEVQFNNAGSPVNGITHDFLDIAGNVLGAPTTVNLLTFAPSGAPAATVGNGIQIVRVSGTTTGSDFTMTSYLLGSYYYDVAYIANYSGSDDGYFLQSSLATPGCSVGGGDDACFIDNTTNQTTPVDALGGNDTLQLTGATNFNFDVSTIGSVYTNFEVFQKADTSTVTLTGTTSESTLGFDIQNGTLIAGTNQLGSLGRVNVFTPGTLEVSSSLTVGSIAGTGTIDLVGGDLLAGGDNTSTTFSGSLVGAGDFQKQGTGTLTLSGTNTNTGLVSIIGGVLEVSGSAAISDASQVVLAPAGTLRLLDGETIGSISGSAGSSVDLGANTLTVGGDNLSTAFAGVISGSGDFEKQGAGTLTLSGANTFTGNMSLFDGGLTIAGAGTLGASTVDLFVQGTLDLGGTTQTVGSLGMSLGTIQNGSLIVNGSTFAQDGIISADLTVTGSFDKAFGSGSLTLSGTNTLSSVGIGEGTLVVANDAALTDTASVNMSYFGFGVGPTLQINTNQTIGSVSGDINSVINLGSNVLTTGGNNASSTFNGFVSGSGGLTKTGTGTFTLAGTGAYTGTTTVNGGTLALSGGSALSDAGVVVVSSGAVLDLLSSETIGSLDGAGNVSLSGNLTTGGNDASTVYSGSMSGAGQLVKTGTGAMTLTGANTHTGGTNITGGILQVSGVGTLGAASGSLDLSAGAGLDLGGTSQTVGSFTSSGAVYNGTLTVTGLTTLFAGNASANLNLATLNKSGAGAATLSGTNSTGAVNVLGGSLVLSGGSAISDSSAVSVAGGSNLVLSSSETIGSLTGAGGVSLGGGTLLTTGGDNSSTTFSGAISGTGKLVKTGSGLFTLGGLNSFTGGIDIVHGGIRLLNNSAAGTGPITTYGSVISYANAVNNAAPIILSSNTTQLEVLAADAAIQSGAISEVGGSRPLEKIGTGTLTLSGPNSFTGPMTITAGTLNVTGGSALSNSAAVNVGAAGTFSVSGSETIGSLAGSGILSLGSGTTLTTGADNSSSLFSGTSSGLGGLTKTGTGTMTLTGTNAFGGALNVAGGNLTVTPSGSLNGMSSFSVLGGASAFLGGSVQGVNGGGMTGAGLGALSVNASGTLYLDDNTSLSGTTLNLASGSNLNLFLTTNTSQYPQISLSGSANIANANVGVYLDPISFSGTLATSFTYSNVITGSGVTGTFGTVNLAQSPSGLFTVAGIYTPTSAGLQVTRNAFSTLGGNGGNQDSVGDALEDIFINGPTDPDLLNLFTVIGSTPAGGVPAIYTAISGAENAENTGNSLRTDDPWKQSVAERVNAARTTGCTVAGETWCLRRYAQATTNGGDVMSDIQGDPTAFDWLETGIRDAGSFSVWGRIIGAWGETSGDVNGPGSTQTTGGFIGGADHVFNSLLLAGVAMQYVETDVDYDQSRNGSLIRSGQMGAYVSYGGAEAFVNGNISVIGSQASAKRFMSIGLIDYDVESLARSWTVTASVESGTIMEIDGYRFEPSLAFNYQAAHPLDFEEKGGGGLSLIVRPDDSQSLRSILSARLSRVYDVGDRKLVPQLRIDWRHEMLDRRQEFSAAFAGDPTVFFDIDGAVYARDVFAAGASVTMPITGRITGYVDAQGAFSEDSTSAMVSVGGRATW